MINNAVFYGAPTSNISQSTLATNSGLDTSNGVLYYTANGGRNRMNGWYPLNDVVAYSLNTAVIFNETVLTFTVPVTGMYKVSAYEVSTNNATSGTLPNVTVTYTDVDTGLTVTLTPVTALAGVSGKGHTNSGSCTIRALIGTQIVVATTGYVAGSPVPLAYTVQANVSFRG